GFLAAAQSGLGGCQPGNWHAVRRATHVVEAYLVAELNRAGVAAMLAADADLKLRVRLAAALFGHADELADAVAVEHREGIVLHHADLRVGLQELAAIVARKAEGRLSQVVGAEAEELGLLGNLVGNQSGARQLDHRADHVANLHALLGEYL